MRLPIALAAVALVVAVGPGWAGPRPTELLQEEALANEACRDGAEGMATDAACKLREMIDRKIKAAGWCYGHPGENGSQQNWHACDR